MTEALKILLVEDDSDLAEALCDSFELAGLGVVMAKDGQAALQALHPQIGLVVSDLRMPRMDGLQLLAAIKDYDGELPVILMTGHGDIAMAVKALHDGAFDFLAKPFAIDHLIAQARRALQTHALVLENRRLRAEALQEDRQTLLGQAPVMLRLRQTMRQIAPLDVDVLILGETGTGKATAARHLHQLSSRRRRPFVRLDCAALPESLAQEVLFGGRGGRGKIEEAEQGTLYLTDVESLPMALQARLLSVLTQREMQMPMGAARTVNIRLIASSKIDLVQAVGDGRFHGELYYRLETLRLMMPPLRQRQEDIPLLLSHFMAIAAAHHNRPLPHMTAEIAAELAHNAWQGNLQELENYATRLVLGLDESERGSDATLAQQLDRFEAELLRRSLERHHGDVNASALALGLPRRSLYARLQRYGIEPASYRKIG